MGVTLNLIGAIGFPNNNLLSVVAHKKASKFYMLTLDQSQGVSTSNIIPVSYTGGIGVAGDALPLYGSNLTIAIDDERGLLYGAGLNDEVAGYGIKVYDIYGGFDLINVIPFDNSEIDLDSATFQVTSMAVCGNVLAVAIDGISVGGVVWMYDTVTKKSRYYPHANYTDYGVAGFSHWHGNIYFTAYTPRQLFWANPERDDSPDGIIVHDGAHPCGNGIDNRYEKLYVPAMFPQEIAVYSIKGVKPQYLTAVPLPGLDIANTDAVAVDQINHLLYVGGDGVLVVDTTTDQQLPIPAPNFGVAFTLALDDAAHVLCVGYQDEIGAVGGGLMGLFQQSYD